MNLHVVKRGEGKPLLLLHGIGGSWRSWDPIIDRLAAQREVIAVDLPGHGQSPALAGENSIYTLTDALIAWLEENRLTGIDCVGSSMGARVVLELARRGALGAVVSLDPGGFWEGWQVPAFYYSIAASVRLVRLLQPVMPALAGNALGRTLLLAQFSVRPWKVPAEVALNELRSLARTSNFDELLKQLAYGKTQQGAPKGSIRAPLVIGWGRQDRVVLPSQSAGAMAAFPDARLHWFDACGHYPHWDQPAQTTELILSTVGGRD